MGKLAICRLLPLFLLVLMIMETPLMTYPVNAQGSSIGWEFDWGLWNNTACVGQPVVFDPSVTGGAPPYTFQWYTQKYFEEWGTPIEEKVLVSTSTGFSTNFTFIPSNPGWYAISVRITDSLGHERYFEGLGARDGKPVPGIWVHVLETTIPPQTSPSLAPIVVLLSPENTSYTAIYDPHVTLPLEFQTNNSLSWVGYSLDGGNNITVTNGTTIDISAESKSLTLYANDTAGNWASPQTVYYEIALNSSTARQSFPIVPATVASMIAVFIIIFSLLLYFKKQKHKK